MFFGPLKRRDKYSAKQDGSFYSYAYFREHFQSEIAEDCRQRCVYCDSHEDEMGGRDSMQIDHFRPYTRAGFEDFEDDPTNFNHACARCNLLKRDHWPSTAAGATHDGLVGFVDPFEDLRSTYFSVDRDGTIRALQHPAAYIIGLLALDRPHLRRLRQRRILQRELRRLITEQMPILEAANRGESSMSREEATALALRLARMCKECLLD